jgi:hypothetical protein
LPGQPEKIEGEKMPEQIVEDNNDQAEQGLD